MVRVDVVIDILPAVEVAVLIIWLELFEDVLVKVTVPAEARLALNVEFENALYLVPLTFTVDWLITLDWPANSPLDSDILPAPVC